MSRSGGPKTLSVAELEAGGSKKWARLRKRLDATESDSRPAEFPDKPSRMSTAAAAFWDELRLILEPLGIVDERSTWTLERYCEMFVAWRRAVDTGGSYRNTCTLSVACSRLAKALGILDAARTKTAAPKDGDWFLKFCSERSPNAGDSS